MDIFDKIVGQEALKRNLKFRLEGYKTNGFIQPVLFEGSWGGGKTSLMRTLAKNLISPTTNETKTYFEKNGSELKNVGILVNSVIQPYDNCEYTLAIDELQSASSLVLNWLLSVLQASDDKTSSASFDGTDYFFDFKKQTFLFATTNPEKLTDAFKSRCLRLVLEPYSTSDICKIVSKSFNDKGIECSDDLKYEISKFCRNVPRQAKNRINDIFQFCEIHNILKFNENNWLLLRRELGILPLGLLPMEFKALEVLFNNQSGITLTALANKLRLDAKTVRKDVENFLQENGLLKIDTKRFITKEGINIFKEALAFKNI